MNYMICKWIGKENNAAVKATEDINKIFRELSINNKVVNIWKHNIKYIRNIEHYFIYLTLKFKLTRKDNVLIQYPLYCIPPVNYKKYLKLPHKQLIAYIQDIESYRYSPKNFKKLEKEIKILNNFDIIIAHNESMIKFLKERGVNANFIDWEICDYLIPEPKTRSRSDDIYSICYVGDIERSDFLRKETNNLKINLNLYGKLDDKSLLRNNLIYRGVYNPNKNNNLDSDFGLIWEGSSIDTCDGIFGNYMTINNPNRLSLYLANNMPIIIWRKAALSSFVVKNKLGFAIDSLSEIEKILNEMSKDEYEEIFNNTKIIGEKIRTGYYTKKVIKSICE